jgi:hypothetical protein
VANAVTALLMLLAAAGAWAGLGWVIMDIPPARPFALVVVYLFAFTGLSSSAALGAWAIARPRDAAGGLASPASYLGHAALLAVIALFGLWLQSLRMLTPVVGLLLVGLYAFLELALLFGTRGAVDLDVRPALEQRRDA